VANSAERRWRSPLLNRGVGDPPSPSPPPAATLVTEKITCGECEPCSESGAQPARHARPQAHLTDDFSSLHASALHTVAGGGATHRARPCKDHAQKAIGMVRPWSKEHVSTLCRAGAQRAKEVLKTIWRVTGAAREPPVDLVHSHHLQPAVPAPQQLYKPVQQRQRLERQARHHRGLLE
jgi:hypothetical protein